MAGTWVAAAVLWLNCIGLRARVAARGLLNWYPGGGGWVVGRLHGLDCKLGIMYTGQLVAGTQAGDA